MADTDTIEREETLELIDTSKEETLDDDDIVHQACCQWPMFVLFGRTHYALCGVKLDAHSAIGTNSEVDCPACLEIERTSNGHLCPMVMFGGRL